MRPNPVSVEEGNYAQDDESNSDMLDLNEDTNDEFFLLAAAHWIDSVLPPARPAELVSER